jgi:hypothetical protein
MSIDIYQQCPCHEDKKIKFCCGKNIVNDLNEVLAKNQSGQTQAALDQLNRAIETIGPKDCLVTIKTFIQISIGDVDGAAQTNTAFLKQAPKHPTGLQHKSMIEAMRGDCDAATHSLQDAMDAIKGTELPISLAQAFQSIGMAHISQRNLLPARAHIAFAQFLKGDDPQLERILGELYNPPGASLFLKANHELDPPVEGVEWEKMYTNVHRAVGRGQFRKALKMLKKIDEQFPDQPQVIKGMAVVTSMFAPQLEQAAAWRAAAEFPSTSAADAIEFYGLADVIGTSNGDEGYIPVTRSTWEIEDFESVKETCISSEQMEALTPAPEQDPFGEGPPPRACFILFDKPALTSAENIEIGNVPLSLGELLLYGKQTDRSARVELVRVENELFDSAIEAVTSILGGAISGDPKKQEFDKANRETDCVGWNWRLPEDIDTDTHRQLVEEMKKVALDRWADLKHETIGGQSVREVAGDPKHENWVQSKLLQLRNFSGGEAFSEKSLNDFRAELKIPLLEKLAPEEGTYLTPVQMTRIDAEKLDDESLVGYMQVAMMTQNDDALRLLTPEVLKREHLEGMRRDICYVNMARFAEDHDEAFEHFANARAEAAKMGLPIGILLVAEFEYRLRNGIEEKLDTLLGTIEARHMEEPNVEQELARLFHAMGITPGGLPQGAEEEMSGAASAEAPAAETGKESSGLWLPD